MSAGWWQSDSAADEAKPAGGDEPASGSPPGPIPSSPHQPLPAILLRLPPAFHLDAARRPALLRVPAAGHAECGAGFTIGTPVSRYGAFKLWRAKSVDLRALLFGFFGLRSPFAPPADPNEDPDDRREMGSSGLTD